MQDLIAELTDPITGRWPVAVTLPCEDAIVRGDNDEFVAERVDGPEEHFLFGPGTHAASSRFATVAAFRAQAMQEDPNVCGCGKVG